MSEMALQASPKIDVNKAIQLKLLGQTYREIAKVFNVTHAAVYQRIKDLLPDVRDLEAYKKNKADIFDSHATQILSTITKTDIEKENVRARMQSVKDLNEMARLERHEATVIHEVRSFNVQADVSKLFT